MTQFYADYLEGEVARLSKEDSHHALRVLRMRPGDEAAIVFDGCRYLAVLNEAGDFLIQSGLESTEPQTKITVYQGISKGERMEYTVQKCAEVGVHSIVPVIMERCVAGLNDKKLERLNRIAKEAGRQAQRTRLPEVLEPIGVDTLAERLKTHEQSLILWEEEQKLSLNDTLKGYRDIALVIGPEGGITPEEREKLAVQAVTLGKRILRTETAGPVAAACVLCLQGDMQ